MMTMRFDSLTPNFNDNGNQYSALTLVRGSPNDWIYSECCFLLTFKLDYK